MATVGPQADCSVFGEYIQKNMRLYELENQINLSTFGAANFIRGELAKALRRGPYQVNLLLGGAAKDEEASLFWMDYLGTLQKVNYGAHGYASNFVLSLLDAHWEKGLTEEQAIEVLRKCIKELETRFMIALPKWSVKVVDSEGVRVIDFN
uniref:Proteasome subunit beta n=2 Tax=Phaeomonas parva TaxID=124430 RepID=A0A6U4BZU5_9STRA|mmetsp:Transcript_10550/g.31826  ORF Transcript_10550/g.31826 Transcript_10550/m.31826 type:complete len:151 (+) Transcript_10550:456-908(+)